MNQQPTNIGLSYKDQLRFDHYMKVDVPIGVYVSFENFNQPYYNPSNPNVLLKHFPITVG